MSLHEWKDKLVSIPEQLRRFFDETWELRLAISFTDGHRHWGVFFGTGAMMRKRRGSQKHAARGRWECTVGWESSYPLLLLPLSEAANTEALNGQPSLKSSGELHFHNGRSKVSNKYEFAPERDAIAHLDAGTVTLNKDRGQWLTWEKEGQKFPFWIADKKLQASDRLISFPSQATRLVGNNGELQNAITPWIGRSQRDPEKLKQHEALVFAIANATNGYGDDAPVVWRLAMAPGDTNSLNRLDDIPITKPDLNLWEEDNDPPLGEAEDNTPVTGSNRRPVKRLFDNGKGSKAAVLPWLWQPSNASEASSAKPASDDDSAKPLEWFPLFVQKRENITVSELCNVTICTLELRESGGDHMLVRVAGHTLDTEIKFWCGKEKGTGKVDDIAASLRLVDRGSPITLGPKITSLSDLSDGRKVWLAEWQSVARRASNDLEGWKLKNVLFLDPPKKDQEFTLPGVCFTTGLEEPPEFTGKVLWPRESSLDIADVGSFLALPIQVEVPKKALEIADGSICMVLTSVADKEPSKEPSWLLLRAAMQDSSGNVVPPWRVHAANAKRLTLDFFRIDGRIKLKEIRPIGQDPLPTDQFLADASAGAITEGLGERAEPPLVISSSAIEGPFWLRTRESISPGQSHRLEVEIERDPEAKDSAEVTAVILDSSPQLVAQVRCQPFRGTGGAGSTNTIARRSPLSIGGEGWEFYDEQALNEGFTLELPAQAIGEQAIKKETDLKNGEQSDVRFGAPLQLQILPSRLDRNYTPVPWNLRRLFLERGAVSPGLPLISARFELLYALQGTLQAPRLLIGELSAKLGEVPFPLPAAEAWPMKQAERERFIEAWQRYLALYRAWAKRLAVLEVSHELDPLKPVEITQGIEYRARIEPTSSDPNHYNKPRGAELEWPLSEPMDDYPELKHFHALKDGGLKGGAFWGFEMLEIYREFWQNYDKSSSGAVSGLAFTSLGGYGTQTARFANDKTVIQSETSLGRTHVYAVERIGRIGVFWHKAKHVIQFERSAAPSEQFPQTGHQGRPLLRKVAEYIEILEPLRSYPDFAGQDPSLPGCVRKCTFPSKRMPVLSTWGGTVRTPEGVAGIEIPLWKLGMDEVVYPKPQITLGIKAPPDSGLETVPVVIEEPQNLYFYSDTRPIVSGITIGANVHEWPSVAEVDYTDLADPVCPAVAAGDNINPDAQLPGAIEVPPGFERFTFRVSPSAMPCDVGGAYYPDCRLTGIPRTVTMLRSAPKDAATPEDDNLKAVEAVATKVKEVADSYLTGTATSQEELEKVLTDLRGNLTGEFWKKTTLTPPTDSPFKELWCLVDSGDGFKAVGKRLFAELLRQADATLAIWTDVLAKHFEPALRQLDAAITKLIDDGNSVAGDWDVKLTAFENALNSLEGAIEWRLLEEFQLLANDFLSTADKKFSETVELQIAELAGSYSHDNLKKCVEAARKELLDSIPADFPNDAKSWIEGRIEVLVGSLNDKIASLPNPVEKTQIETFKRACIGRVSRVIRGADVTQAFQKQIETIGTTVQDIRQKLDRGTESVAQALEAWRTHVAKELSEAQEKVKSGLKDLVQVLLVGGDWNSCNAPSSGLYMIVKLVDTKASDVVECLLETLIGDDGVNKVASELGKRLNGITDTIEQAQRLAAEFARLGGEVEAVGRELKAAKQKFQDLRQNGTNALRHVRSVWDEFTAPGMAGNRRRIELITNPRALHPDLKLTLTPFIARVRGAADQLEGLGLRLPAVALTDRLLPALESYKGALKDQYGNVKLEKFDFSNILSDIGGIRLNKLFPGLSMPFISRENLIVTQGFDKNTLTAWADAKADVRLAGDKTLLGFEVLRVAIRNGRFRGHVRVEIDPEGKTQKVSTGGLVGDWVLAFNGIEMMIFREVALRFEGGKLDFDLDPSKMESPGLLSLITQASSRMSSEKDGFRIAPIVEGMVPVGIRADFGMGPLGASGGVSGLQNVHIGGHFQLQLFESNAAGKLDLLFSLGTGFYLGKRDIPFTIAIFILGGGGFFECAFKFYPLERSKLTSYLRLSLHASATVAFAAGWINGSVGLYLGIEGTYEKKQNQSASLQFSQFVLVVGYVKLINLVTVHLVLRLDCTIRRQGGVTIFEGSGEVAVTIRISRFFKISVRRTYTHEIARRGDSGRQPSLMVGSPTPAAAPPSKTQILADILAN